MFCDHCGSPLHPTSKFCSACGKPVIPLPSLSPTLSRSVQSEDRIRRHINRLAILWLANGVLRLMLVLWFFGASRYSMPPVFGPARLWAQPFWHGHAWNSILLILALFGIGHLVLAWDKFGRPLWAPGIAANELDRLNGYEYVINQLMPQFSAVPRQDVVHLQNE